MAVQAHFYSENLGLPMPDWNLVNPVPPPPSVLTTFDGGPSCFNLHDQHHPPLFSNVQQTQVPQNQNLDAMAFSQSLNPLLESQSQEIGSLLHSQVPIFIFYFFKELSSAFISLFIFIYQFLILENRVRV